MEESGRHNDRVAQRRRAAHYPACIGQPDNTPMSLEPPRQVELEEIWLRRAGDVARGGEREELS